MIRSTFDDDLTKKTTARITPTTGDSPKSFSAMLHRVTFLLGIANTLLSYLTKRETKCFGTDHGVANKLLGLYPDLFLLASRVLFRRTGSAGPD